MPHLGHLPGLSLKTSGCMVQVYCTFAGFAFLVVSVVMLPLCVPAAKTVAAENRMAIAINVTFFMSLKFKMDK
jgi:hypothetical protein